MRITSDQEKIIKKINQRLVEIKRVETTKPGTDMSLVLSDYEGTIESLLGSGHIKRDGKNDVIQISRGQDMITIKDLDDKLNQLDSQIKSLRTLKKEARQSLKKDDKDFKNLPKFKKDETIFKRISDKKRIEDFFEKNVQSLYAKVYASNELYTQNLAKLSQKNLDRDKRQQIMRDNQIINDALSAMDALTADRDGKYSYSYLSEIIEKLERLDSLNDLDPFGGS